jgi:hypothetical protein
MTGGTALPGLVTTKESVRQAVEVVTATPPVAGTPFWVRVKVSVAVDGPEMANVLKSSRSC